MWQKDDSPVRITAPVAINQILDWPSNRRDVPFVRVVGIIKKIHETDVKITYTIEDSTGSVLGVAYRESDAEDNNARVPVVENTYCVMTGSVCSNYIKIFDIYPVTDFYEILEHYLSVMKYSNYFK